MDMDMGMGMDILICIGIGIGIGMVMATLCRRIFATDHDGFCMSHVQRDRRMVEQGLLFILAKSKPNQFNPYMLCSTKPLLYRGSDEPIPQSVALLNLLDAIKLLKRHNLINIPLFF